MIAISLKTRGKTMANITALEALTAPNPNERHWIIRGAAELIVKDNMFSWDMPEPVMARCAAILAAGQLATDAPRYLAELGMYGWTRLAIDILICARWAIEEKWSF